MAAAAAEARSWPQNGALTVHTTSARERGGMERLHKREPTPGGPAQNGGAAATREAEVLSRILGGRPGSPVLPRHVQRFRRTLPRGRPAGQGLFATVRVIPFLLCVQVARFRWLESRSVHAHGSCRLGMLPAPRSSHPPILTWPRSHGRAAPLSSPFLACDARTIWAWGEGSTIAGGRVRSHERRWHPARALTAG